MNPLWQEIECGAYGADLSLWAELADRAEGPVLDLGCGTGRVARHLARHGHRVVGLDVSPELVDAFNEAAGSTSAQAEVGDARDFDLDREFGLALAPMQLLQLFADASERVRCLRCVARHLADDGVAAAAIVEDLPAPVDAPPPLPDTREVDGWVYSSLPLETVVGSERIVVRRLRQMVSPEGELSEALDETHLSRLSALGLEREATAAGLRPAGHRAIVPTDDHVGSTVVLLGKGS